MGSAKKVLKFTAVTTIEVEVEYRPGLLNRAKKIAQAHSEGVVIRERIRVAVENAVKNDPAVAKYFINIEDMSTELASSGQHTT